MTLKEQVDDYQGTQSPKSHTIASVIVISYNQRIYLPDCLDSIQRTVPEGCEVLFMDNGSSDGSANYVELNYPSLKVFSNSTNLGFAGGGNLVAASANGDYLVFLNPDTIVVKGWLEALLSKFQDYPQVGLVTSQILLVDTPDIINTCGNEIHLTGITLCRGAGLKRDALPEQVEVSAISGAAFAIRRDLFEKLGGFDENFFLYMEDTDLSWRARLSGFECIYAPTSIVYHDYELRFKPNKIYYQERNRYTMMIKTLHWGSLLILTPALLLAEIITWGFVLTHGVNQWMEKLRAYQWVIHNRSKILNSRKQTQILRKRSDRHILLSHLWKLDFKQINSGIITTIAHWIFNPLYWTLKGMVYLFIWW